jgi:cytochrome c oxidase cbb3-type subunit 3
MPAFWHWFVAAGTIAFIIWCALLIGWTTKQGPQNVKDNEVVGHKWDGDLQEWNNPAPKWWLYLYFITIVWAVGYLIAFGLADWEGALGWSQQGQYESEMQDAAARYEPIYEQFAAMPFDELSKNADANQLGKSLYASYCTTCHGSDARGATGYPNLTDNDWLWGNSEAALTMTLKNGRNGVMPVLAPALGGEQGVRNMVKYVRSLSGIIKPDAGAISAKPMFLALCSTCHTAEGTGNQLFGAPNLTDDIWLYGSSEEAVYTTIINGRNNMMPAHGDLLGENRTKILAAYIYSLSN